MANTNQSPVNYLSRDFQALRADLISWAKQMHPDLLSYFNDANPDILYMEMCAYVGDMLSYYTDKTFNESFRTTAQSRVSLVRIANDLGFFGLGSKPSQTQLVFTITVPYITDSISGVASPDPDMLISIQPEIKLSASNGQFFEVSEGINFADERNRIIVPNLDSNNKLINYTIQKYAIGVAGQTKIQNFYVSPALAQPFLNIVIDDPDVTEIVGIIHQPGNVAIAPDLSVFNNSNYMWYEVNNLVQNNLFLEINPTQNTSSIKTGDIVDIPRRFVSRRDENNLVTLTFGNSVPSYEAFNNLIQTPVTTDVSLNDVLNNADLGEIPPPNSTLFIKYRSGGGVTTNAQTGQINSIISKTFDQVSSIVDFKTLNKVRNSLTVTNNLPAVGGKDIPGIEEIRAVSGQVFATQDRGVTYPDIKSLINNMPAKYGSPFRVAAEEIKPATTNFVDVRLQTESLLDNLLAQTTQVARQQVAQQITNYFQSIADTGAPDSTAALMNSIPSLWIGEKVRIYILSNDENGNLITISKDPVTGLFNSPQELLKQNIAAYLQNKRIMGDWIDILDARICNIQIEFTILADKNRKQEVLTQCLQSLQAYFQVSNWDLNQPIYVSNVITTLQAITGVINVTSMKFYNIFGIGNNSIDPITKKKYQPQEIGRYRNNLATAYNSAMNKFEMVSTNNIIAGYQDTMFFLAYPETDLVGSVL